MYFCEIFMNPFPIADGQRMFGLEFKWRKSRIKRSVPDTCRSI